MARPTKRKGSENRQFKRRVPSDLVKRLAGQRIIVPVGDFAQSVTIGPDLRFSLRTADPTVAKMRNAEADTFLDRFFEAQRQDAPTALTRRHAVALSGELYRSWSSDPEVTHVTAIEQDLEHGGWVRAKGNDKELAEVLAETADRIEDEGERDEMTPAKALRDDAFAQVATRLLAEKGIGHIDDTSRQMVIEEFRRAFVQALRVQERKTGRGDFGPDPDANRFPAWPQGSGTSVVSLQGIYDRWEQDAKARGLAASTFDAFGRAFRQFRTFLGHDDAARVTRVDVERHLERRGQFVSRKTVKEGDLAALRVVFNFAVKKHFISDNPTTGVVIEGSRETQVRHRYFTPSEIRSILQASMGVERRPRWSPRRTAAMRWVPWLCAYTGARVGEIVQLRQQDVWQEDVNEDNGTKPADLRWVIRITPEAGTEKTRRLRDVVLHPHLIEQGFVEFAQSASGDRLFMWSGEGRSAWRTAKNRVRDFVRQAVTDPNVAPNHGWRHTFRRRGFEAGIPELTLDAICGHSPKTVGQYYTEVTLAGIAEAMDRYPRYQIDPQSHSHKQGDTHE